MGYGLCCHKELDTTEQLAVSFFSLSKCRNPGLSNTMWGTDTYAPLGEALQLDCPP